MVNTFEIKQKADELKKNEDFDNALLLYKQLYELETTDWNGYFLAQCLRKTDNFTDARKIIVEIKKKSPSFNPIKNEELWLDYNEKIKDWENPNLIADAEELLSKTNKYDKYTGSIYNKTVLSVVKHLIYSDENNAALEWLEKLDFNVLSNAPFTYKGMKYPSDQKAYFIRYADVLIKLSRHSEYIEKCLNATGFLSLKQQQFKDKIINEITFQDYISRIVLALYIKQFKEEIHNRKNNNYNKNYNNSKITIVSDLSDFEFCPVSFAINETFNIPSNELWEKDEWASDKKYLLDRYNIYQRKNNIEDSFSDTTIEINDRLKTDFYDIFSSQLISHNYDGKNKKYYSNVSDTIRGNPDYIFLRNGSKFVVVEKFTKRTSEDIENAFSNDLAKLWGYIFELQSLSLSYGYLIYWYWFYDEIYDENDNVHKKIRIKAYRIFKVEKNQENLGKLNVLISKVSGFKRSKKLEIDGTRISYPNKCLHCSVYSYCIHKTGQFNTVVLPYNINEIKAQDEPILIKTTDIIIENLGDDDDLPF